MKSYYFRNIVNQIIKSKKESIIVFFIVFNLTFFLSQVHFFGYNQTIEKNIANHLNLSQEIMNNHVFSNNANNADVNEITNKNSLFYDVIEMIDEIGHSKYVDLYNYNLVLDRECYLSDFQNVSYDKWFGISTKHYLEKNGIELVEGRMMTQKEIDEGKPVIIVSDDAMLWGENRPIKLGDKIVYKEVSFEADGTKPVELEVIGIYKREFKHFQTYGVNDEFVNSGCSLVSNQLILNLINDLQDFPFSNMKINRIVFYVNDYNNDYPFKVYLLNQLKEFEKDSKKNYGIDIKFQLMPSKNSSIINSITQIKTIYKVVFTVVICIVLLLFVAIIHYLIKKKTQEIKIYYSLGQTKIKIICQYIFIYLIISFLSMIIALILGYFTSQLLLSSMIANKIEVQSEIMRFSEGYNISLTNEELLVPDYHFNAVSSVKIIVEVIGVIVVSVSLSVKSLFNPIKTNDKGVRKWKKS